jgi:hypothetical protein
MKVIPRRCECLWCQQVFYSGEFYKYGTCSSCLLFKEIMPVPKLADLLKQAEEEAKRQLRG